jgi:hypothetical protein
MKKLTIRRIISLFLTAALLTAIAVTPAAPLVTEVAANNMFVIHNPYAHVNWSTFRQFKAGLHNHTTNSDGDSRLSTMAETHWDLGYHIVAFTDHSFTTPSPDRVPLGAMTPERIAQMAAGRGRSDGRGMIFVPYSNERSVNFPIIDDSRRHHMNTYWSNIGNRTETTQESLTRMEREGSGGLAHLNHIGRYTGAEYPTPLAEALRISNRSENFQPYVELFRNHNNLIGMEIVGTFDEETQGDKVLWDNILQRVMPRHPVWGFANDDAHFQRSVGFAYNLMLMPSLSLSEYRYAKESGAFFAFSRVDRVYDVFPGAIVPRNRFGHQLSSSEANEVRNMSVPSISRIDAGSDRITIEASNYDSIRWYSNGREIHRGNSINLQTRLSGISDPRYVRAVVINNRRGVLFTQPFGIERTADARADLFPTLLSVDTIRPITIPTGSPATEAGLRLPGGVNIQTRGGTNAGTLPATIIWDLRNINYNPNNTARQTFAVPGTIRLNRVINPNNVPLNVSIQITAEAGVCGTCPPVTEQVWSLDYSRLTTAGGGGGDAGTPASVSGAANLRSLGNGTGTASYRPGIRRESGDNNPMTLSGTPPTSFRWANSRNSRSGLNLETGAAAGGTALSRNDASGFNAAVGETYRVRFNASGSGELRVSANRGGSDPGITTVNLTSSNAAVSHTWTQVSGNVFLELGIDATVNISGLRVERIVVCDGNWCGSCCSDYPGCLCGACEYCGTRPCSCRQATFTEVAHNWSVNSTPADLNAGLGASDHVLALSGLSITSCMIEADRDATLRIAYTAAGNNSNRRILAWTNLSGGSAGSDSIAFLTTANLTGENIAISPERITAGAREATLVIPNRLLHRGNNTASVIYVAITTDEGLTGTTSAGSNRYTAAANHRGGGESGEFERFATVTLTMEAAADGSPPRACVTCSNLPCRCVLARCETCGERICACPPDPQNCSECGEVECRCCDNCDTYPCACPARCPECNNLLNYCDCGGGGGLEFAEIMRDSSGNAWFLIRNNDVVTRTTRGIVLELTTDSGVSVWRLPALTIRPGKIVSVFMGSIDDDDSPKRMHPPFNMEIRGRVRLFDRVTGEDLPRSEEILPWLEELQE